MIRTVLNNMRETEVWMDAEADVDFTVVRPAGLTDAAVTKGEFKVAEGDYHVSIVIWMNSWHNNTVPVRLRGLQAG